MKTKQELILVAKNKDLSVFTKLSEEEKDIVILMGRIIRHNEIMKLRELSQGEKNLYVKDYHTLETLEEEYYGN